MSKVIGDIPQELRQILQLFTEGVGSDILVHKPESSSGDLFPPSKHVNRLTIYFGKAPAIGPYSGGEEAIIKSAFGVHLSVDQWYSYTPSLLGERITDEDGHTVAEVVDNTLFILFDIANDFNPRDTHTNKNTQEVLRKIMDKFLELPSLSERKKQIAARKEELDENSWKEFVSIAKTFEKHIPPADIKKQFEFLTKMARGNLVVTNGEIRVPLGHKIAITNRGRKVNIGDVFFKFERPRHLSDVKIFHLTPGKMGTHDYIYSHGIICLGNISSGVDELLEKGEFGLAAEAVKLFVEEFVE